MEPKQRVSVTNQLLIDVEQHELDMDAVEDERMGRFRPVIDNGMVEECDETNYFEWKAFAHHPTMRLTYINDRVMTDPNAPGYFLGCEFCCENIVGSMDIDWYRTYTYYHCTECHIDFCANCVNHDNMDHRTRTTEIDHCMENHKVRTSPVTMPQLRCQSCKSMLSRDIYCKPRSVEKDTLCVACYQATPSNETKMEYVRCKYINEWDFTGVGSLLDWVPVVQIINHDVCLTQYISKNVNRLSPNFGKFLIILISTHSADCMATFVIDDIDEALHILKEDRPVADYPGKTFLNDDLVHHREHTEITHPHPDRPVHLRSRNKIRDLAIKLGHTVYDTHIEDMTDIWL